MGNPSFLIKRSEVGENTDQKFEEAFSSLSYSYLRANAPRLLDYAVGFQVIDRDEDKGKSVGVFGFNSGDKWLYAPVFFLGGMLKGNELLYSKNHDWFVPLNEDWVTHLLSRGNDNIGESVDRGNMSDYSTPDLSQYSRSPSLQKMSRDLGISEWAIDAVPMIQAGMGCRARFVFPDTETSSILDFQKVARDPGLLIGSGISTDLMDVVGEHPRAGDFIKAAMNGFPGVARGMRKFYGDDVSSRIDSIVASVPALKKKASGRFLGSLNNKVGGTGLFKESKDSTRVEIIRGPGVSVQSIWMSRTISHDNAHLNTSEKEDILRDGYLIKDDRKDSDKSDVYDVSETLDLVNPTNTGIYDVLTKLNTYERMLVIKNPASGIGKENILTVVKIKPSGSLSYLNSDPAKVFVKDGPFTSDYDEWFEGLPDSKVSEGGSYVLIGKNGNSTTPFRVTGVDGDLIKVLFDSSASRGFNRSRSWDNNFANPGVMPPVGRLVHDSGYSHGGDGPACYNADSGEIRINHRDSSAIRFLGGKLVTPSSFKAVKLKGVDPYSPDEETSIIELGRLVDLESQFLRGTSRVKVFGSGSEATTSSEKTSSFRGSWNETLFHLIKNHGMSELDARGLIKDAQVGGQSARRVKYAAPYPIGMDDNPSYNVNEPERAQGMSQAGRFNIPTNYSQESESKITGLPTTDRGSRYPWEDIDPRVMQVAQQASNSGSKDVFDVSVLGSMLKSFQDESLVDQYIGDIAKSMDRMGRILFMSYWNQDKYIDRYGKEELPEMQESLKNAFNITGVLVLSLKEKSVGGMDDHGMYDIGDITGS